MDYDPDDHVPSGRRVIAAWLVCLVVAAPFVAPAALHRATAVIGKAQAHAAAAINKIRARPSANGPALCQRHVPPTRG